MTNREWILKEMKNMSDKELAKILHVTSFIPDVCKQDCAGRLCTDCKISWLKEKHKEKIKLSNAERVILENIDKKYQWIARDKNNMLCVYEVEPRKVSRFWGSSNCMEIFDFFNHLFQFIKWEDEEPYEIKELLK